MYVVQAFRPALHTRDTRAGSRAASHTTETATNTPHPTSVTRERNIAPAELANRGNRAPEALIEPQRSGRNVGNDARDGRNDAVVCAADQPGAERHSLPDRCHASRQSR